MQIKLVLGQLAPSFVRALLVCVFAAVVLQHGHARAENVVIPSGVSGLMTVEFTYTEADFVNAFGS